MKIDGMPQKALNSSPEVSVFACPVFSALSPAYCRLSKAPATRKPLAEYSLTAFNR
jgi:hypothetical protein